MERKHGPQNGWHDDYEQHGESRKMHVRQSQVRQIKGNFD